MRIKTKSRDDAFFFYEALKLIGPHVHLYYGRSSMIENGPTRGYWTIQTHKMGVDHLMMRSWFPDRPFIYSDTPKESVWRRSEDIVKNHTT